MSVYRRVRWISMLATIGMLFSACGGETPAQVATTAPTVSVAATTAPASSPTVEATATQAATATLAATATSAVPLGDEQRNEAGGYSFRVPDGWAASELGVATVIQQESNQDVEAPTFILEGGVGEGLIITTTEDFKTSDDLLDKVLSDIGDNGRPGDEANPRTDISIAGVDGRTTSLQFVSNDQPLLGRAAATMVSPEQRFLFVGAAKVAEWSDVAGIFDAILGSVDFFEPVPEPTPTPEPTEAPVGPGGSRSAPLALGTGVRFTTWAVTVTNVLRGEEAAQAIEAANEFNSDPPEGFQYILATVQVGNISTESTSEEVGYGVYLHATGSDAVDYSLSGLALATPLQGELFPGGQIEGQVGFAVPADITDLMIQVEETTSTDDKAQYFIAVDPDASVVPAAEYTSEPKSSDVGADMQNPAALGDTIRTDGWEATIIEYKRGTAAADFVKEKNEFADAADAGREYVLVQVRVRNLNAGGPDEASLADSSYLKIVGERNEVYDATFVSIEPRLNGQLFPGGQLQGWAVLQVEEGEKDLKVIFEPLFSFDEATRRYIALPNE